VVKRQNSAGVLNQKVAVTAQESSPGKCLVSATVISIDNILEKSDLASPCANAPCKAKILIDKVFVCGSGIAEAPAIGDSINANFAFTLFPTEKIFPALKPSFSGLQIGSKFKATLDCKPMPGGKSNFIIYDYEVLK
jgi:hypothetical protein